MITASGFIVCDGNGFIFGTGETAVIALYDAIYCLAQAHIAIVPDHFDMSAHEGSALRHSDLKTHAATADLIAAVEEQGGAMSWTIDNDIACTREEAGQ